MKCVLFKERGTTVTFVEASQLRYVQERKFDTVNIYCSLPRNNNYNDAFYNNTFWLLFFISLLLATSVKSTNNNSNG